MLEERFILASERIREIPEEEGMVAPAFEDFFQTLARLILAALSLAEAGERERALPEDIFGDIRPGRYEKSYACPSFACQKLGEDPGRPLSVLYYEIFGMVVPALLGSREEMLIRMELFLEVYQAFVIQFRETGTAPEGRYITGKIGQYLTDYFREETRRRLKALTREEGDFSGLFPETPFSLPPVQEREDKKLAEVLAEGFEKSLAARGFDKKSRCTCGLAFSCGLGQLASFTAAALEKRGIRALPYVGRCSLFDIREDIRIPAFSWADPCFYQDHREDLGMFLDESMRTRILQAMETALSGEREDLSSFGGWIVLTGKEEKSPAFRQDPAAVRLGRHQRKMLAALLERGEEMIREAGLFLTVEDVFSKEAFES